MKRPESRVFIVEDDPSMRNALKNLLRSVGLDCQLYTSAQEFLDAEKPEVPSCLILDVRLPGMSGLDLQKELGKEDIQIPVIFITAHGDIPMSVRAMKAGAVEFLPKPFRDQDLLDAIQMSLMQDRKRRERDRPRARHAYPFKSAAPRSRGRNRRRWLAR